jgi:hypothetical protein
MPKHKARESQLDGFAATVLTCHSMCHNICSALGVTFNWWREWITSWVADGSKSFQVVHLDVAQLRLTYDRSTITSIWILCSVTQISVQQEDSIYRQRKPGSENKQVNLDSRIRVESTPKLLSVQHVSK